MLTNKIKISEISPQVINSFNHLPFDNYIKGDFNYRRRRYHAGTIKNGAMMWDDNPKLFMQSVATNHYAGGIERNFPPVNSAITHFVGKNVVLDNLYHQLPYQNDYKIGLHQIRIIADENHMGKPAPEGVHQDGFDYICVCCVNTYNVSGGDSILVDAADHASLLYEVILSPGEMLLFDDRKFAHYVSPITPKLPGSAYRDVFVITFKKAGASS